MENVLDFFESNDGALRELALFAGAGGGILGGKLLGWRTICAVERDAYAAQVLAQRQNDGILEAFPIWSDVQTFDGKPWRGIVDVISGGFPCQDISVAGKGAGIEGERSGMWKEFLRIISDIRPRFVFVENSPMLTSRGLGVVLGDLAASGYDAEWTCLSAAEVGANHVRDRIWILGYSNNYGQITPEVIRGATQGGYGGTPWSQQASEFTGSGEQYAELANAQSSGCKTGRRRGRKAKAGEILNMQPINSGIDVANAKIMQRYAGTDNGSNKPAIGEKLGTASGKVPDPDRAQRQRDQFAKRIHAQHADIDRPDWWKTEPEILRVVDGVAARLEFVNDQLKAIGNGQVPLAAATAFKELIARFA